MFTSNRVHAISFAALLVLALVALALRLAGLLPAGALLVVAAVGFAWIGVWLVGAMLAQARINRAPQVERRATVYLRDPAGGERVAVAYRYRARPARQERQP